MGTSSENLTGAPAADTVPAMDSTPALSPLRKKLSIAALCLFNFMVALDATSTSISLATIAQELHTDDTTIYWVGTSFVLCSAVLQPLFAAMTPSVGRIRMLTIAIVLFLIGVIICGCAHSSGVLIAGRCIQGAGAGGILTLTYVVLAVYFDMAQRAAMYGFIGVAWLLGCTTGPLVGGALSEAQAWRWIFWLNIPIAVVCFPSIFVLKEHRATSVQMLRSLAQIDWFGAAFFATALTVFLVPLSWGGTMYPWRSYKTIVPLIIGAVALVAWIFYSYKISANPLIPKAVVSDTTALISFFTTLIHGIIFFAEMYFLPLYLQGVKGDSSIMAGVGILPQCIYTGVSALLTAVLLQKFGCIKPFSMIGWFIMSFGLLYLQLMTPTTTYGPWVLLNISGVGLGILFSALSTATQAAAEAKAARSAPAVRQDADKIRAMAAGLNPFFRAVGQSIGIVIGQAVVNNELKKRVDGALYGDVLASVTYIRSLPAAGPHRQSMALAFLESLKLLWWTLFALAGLAMLLTLFTKESGLGGIDQVFDGEKVDAEYKNDNEESQRLPQSES